MEEEEVSEEEPEEILDPNNPDDAFKILERDFNKVSSKLKYNIMFYGIIYGIF